MNYLMNFRNSCDHEWIAGEDVTKDGSNQIKTYRKPSLFGGMNIHLQAIFYGLHQSTRAWTMSHKPIFQCESSSLTWWSQRSCESRDDTP